MNVNKIIILIFNVFLWIYVGLPAYADITLDGTLGKAGDIALQGPDYEIRAEYGRQVGTNLFHSFGQFDIHTGESATFSGQNSVRNIISRVTGGNPSQIDGLLRSTIPDANLYLLNPAGVMFGPNALLDLGGSFHVTSADYLRLGKNDRFYAMSSEDSVLSIATPTAFGFLDNNVAPIKLEGKGDITERQDTGLTVKKTETISLIGGDIEIKNGSILNKNESLEILDAPEGQINMISVASKGKVILTKSDLDTSSFEKFGNIALTEKSLISVTGDASGNIIIRGGEFFSDNGIIKARTLENKDGGIIDIQVNNLIFTEGTMIYNESFGGNGGDIKIIASESVIFSDNSRIRTIASSFDNTANDGRSGDVLIKAKSISLTNGSGIVNESSWGKEGGDITLVASESVILSGDSSSLKSGAYRNYADAGDIRVEAKNIFLTDGAEINTHVNGGGKGGDITIKASESVIFYGMNGEEGSRMSTTAFSHEKNADKAGDVLIEAKHISFENGGGVNSSTEGTGKGGSITLQADSIKISGINPADNLPSGIDASSQGKEENAGNAGIIHIKADTLSVTDGGVITNSTEGTGGGNDITLEVSMIQLDNNALISSASNYEEGLGGEAGRIIIGKNINEENGEIKSIESVDSVHILNGSKITTQAKNAGGGKIHIHAKEELYLQDGHITSKVAYGEENAGDITIGFEASDGKSPAEGPRHVILNHSEINANAETGDGGAIFIHTDNYIKSADSNVTATSKRGNNGIIRIEAPDLDIVGSMTVLPSEYIDASQWMKTPCEKRSGEDVSRFKFSQSGIPLSPDDWLPSPPLAFDADMADKQGEIGKHLLKGETFYHKGNFGKAIKVWEPIISQLKEEKDEILFTHTLLYLTHAYQAIGYYEKAETLLEEAAEKKKDNKYVNALLYTTFGDLYLSFGNLEKAKEYWEKADSSETGNHFAQAMVLNNKGNIDAVKQDYNGAITNYEDCLKHLGLIDEPSQDIRRLKSRTLINLARARFENAKSERGFYEKIYITLNDALAEIENLQDSYEKVFDSLSLSLLIWQIGKETDRPDLRFSSYQLAKNALEIAKNSEDNNRMISYAYGHLGRLYEDEKNYPEAIRLTRQAIFLSQQHLELSYLWHWQLGRLFKTEGNIENALNVYKKAADILSPEGIRCEKTSSENSEKEIRPPAVLHEFFKGYRREHIFEEKIRPVFLETAELMLNQAEKLPPIKKEEKLREVRKVMDRLKTAEVQNFFADECLTSLDKKIRRLEKIPPRTALLYPIVFPDSVTVLLELPDRIISKKVWVRPEELRETAEGFSTSVANKDERHTFYSKKFYDWLILPFEKELEQIDTLIVAPDGPLRLVPFSAFYNGKAFLIEKYAIVTIPAITLTDTGSFGQKKEKNVSACGISDAVQGFDSLPNVKEELEAIGRITHAKIFLNNEYTLENLKTEFKSHKKNIIHIGTHGTFGRNANETFLLTYDGRVTMDGLEKLVNLGMFRREPLELITLSACQTALGDEQAALGLGGIAIKAGASGAIATLWSVNDKSTYLVIRNFYEQLESHQVSKAKALQNAQTQLMKEYPNYRHPYYWSPFLLIGNWF